MDFHRFEIFGPLEIVPGRIADSRGYFCEVLRMDKIRSIVGDVNFVQENESLSVKEGTIRGIHFQIPPRAQGKLIRCISGSLFDVALDLRVGSRSYGSSITVILNSSQGN